MYTMNAMQESFSQHFADLNNGGTISWVMATTFRRTTQETR